MPSWRNILGISAYYHDAVAAWLRDGRIAAAAQEERFTRKRTIPISRAMVERRTAPQAD